jgi:hypothetical protein
MQTRSRVDVWLAGSTAAQLTPPPRSIVDGDEAAYVVRTCALRREGLSRLAVHLAVDEATAERFARACRLETIWRRKVIPAVLLVVVSDVIAFTIDAAFNDERLQGLLFLATLILAAIMLGGRFMLILLRSRHHPKLVEKNNVVIRDVDRETVRMWVDLNPKGTIEILE